MTRIGINGFGRIGTAVARLALQRNDVEIAVINDAGVNAIAHDALNHGAIDLRAREVLFLYVVRSNIETVIGAAPRTPAYLLYTSASVAYRANARFDAAYWDYASFAFV